MSCGRRARKTALVAKSEGDVDKGLTQGERFDADYELPFLAHATMEPMNCTVRLTPGACEIWTGTQVQTACAGIRGQGRGRADRQGDGPQPLHRRRLRPPARAGHGRERGAHRQAGSTPVKVVWTREEDMQHDVYRPAYRDTISASLSNGKIVAWKYQGHRLVGHGSLAAAGLPERHRYRRRR